MARPGQRGEWLQRRRPRLTYSNVTATLALFIALGGTSYAVIRLPRNSVGPAQLRSNSVSSTKIRNGAVKRADLAVNAQAGTRGARGPQGPQGERGPANVRIAPQAADVGLSGNPGQETQVRRMDAVPAGNWLLRFEAGPQLPAETGLHTTCRLKVNGDVKAEARTVVGNAANATQEAILAVETVVEQPAAFNVTVDCQQNIPSAPPVTYHKPQIIATQVGDVARTP
jgi:hypothetical protein